LKEEIKELVDQEENTDRLEKVKTLLMENHSDPAMKEWMTQRALKAEEDYKAGRVHSVEEVREHLLSRLKK